MQPLGCGEFATSIAGEFARFASRRIWRKTHPPGNSFLKLKTKKLKNCRSRMGTSESSGFCLDPEESVTTQVRSHPHPRLKHSGMTDFIELALSPCPNEPKYSSFPNACVGNPAALRQVFKSPSGPRSKATRIIPIYLPKRQLKNKSKHLFIIMVIWVELP